MTIQDTYLLDEVRNGFLIPATVKQAWAAELEVLAEIDRVCKKHNITYFADWGTLLGVVRHGDFVPWDDDLDIVMKREDYVRFMNVARFDMAEGFDVQTFRNHDDCWLFMGKVVGRNGFSFEKEHLRRFHNFPYIACVDIFVLDYVYRDEEKEEKRRKVCKQMLTVADAMAEGVFSPEERESRLQALEELYGKSLTRIEDATEMRRYLYGVVEEVFAEVPKAEADVLTQMFPRGIQGNGFYFPKEYYAEAVELPFAGTYMPVPRLYDEMLQMRYGEYLRLVKNQAGHDYPFFEGQKKNLQKVLDFKLPEFSCDKERLLRGEEEAQCRQQSYKVMAEECLEELSRLLRLTVAAVEQGNTEQAAALLPECQQLAVDMGNMLATFLPEENAIIPLLEKYCEALYVLYEALTGDGEPSFDSLQYILSELKAELNRNVQERCVALFLPVLARDWTSMQGLWQEMVQDPSWDVYVVPLPYYYKDYDGSPRKVCCDMAEFPEVVAAQEYTLLSPEYLEMLHPEVIVIQNPYDSWNAAIAVPEMFYALQLRRYTDKLVYVPPFAVEDFTKKNEREYFNTKYYVTMPGTVYADEVLVNTENMRDIYVERLTEFAGPETDGLWKEKVMVNEWQMPAVEKGKKQPGEKRRMLYGICLGPYLQDAEAVRKKLENSLRIFEEYKEKVDLSVLIYPNVGENVLGQMVGQMLEEFSGRLISAQEEVRATDYDAYYGDAIPLVMDFREAGVPVMIQDITNLE